MNKSKNRNEAVSKPEPKKLRWRTNAVKLEFYHKKGTRNEWLGNYRGVLKWCKNGVKILRKK